MTQFERKVVHTYYGRPDRNGRCGKLQVFELHNIETAVQPFSASDSFAEASARLSSGCHIPLIGLGTWKSDPGQVKSAVYEALKAGYHHLDCAAIYENEHEVGAALQQAFTEKLIVRERVFVTSKLW